MITFLVRMFGDRFGGESRVDTLVLAGLAVLVAVPTAVRSQRRLVRGPEAYGGSR